MCCVKSNKSCLDMVDYYTIIPFLNKNSRTASGINRTASTQRNEESAVCYYFLCIVLLIFTIIRNIYDKFLTSKLHRNNNIWNNAHHQYIIKWQLDYNNSAVVNIYKYCKFFAHESKETLTESKRYCKLVTYKLMKLSINYIQVTQNNTNNIFELLISAIIHLLFNNSNDNSNKLISSRNNSNCLEIHWISNLLLLTVANYYSHMRKKQLQEIKKWENRQMQQVAFNDYRQKSKVPCPIYSCHLYQKLCSALKNSIYIIQENELHIAAQHNNINYILIYLNNFNYCYTNNGFGILCARVQICHSKCFSCSFCCICHFHESNYCFNYIGKYNHSNNNCQQIRCYQRNYCNEKLKGSNRNANHLSYSFMKNSNCINCWNCSKYVNSSKDRNYDNYFYYTIYVITISKIIWYGNVEIYIHLLQDVKPYCYSQHKLKHNLKFCLCNKHLPKTFKKHNTTWTSYITMHNYNFSMTFQMFHEFLFISLRSYNIKHYSKLTKYIQIISTTNSNYINSNNFNQDLNVLNYTFITPFISTKFKKFKRSCKNDHNCLKSQNVYHKHPIIIIANYHVHVKIQDTGNRYKTLTSVFTSKSHSTLMLDAYISTNKVNTNLMQRNANTRMRLLPRYKTSKTSLVWLLIGLVWLEEPKYVTCNIIINYQYLQHQQQLQPHYQQKYQHPQQPQNTSSNATKTTNTKTTYCGHLDPFRLYHHSYKINNSYNIDIYDIITKNTEFCKNYQTVIQTHSDGITNLHRNNNDFEVTLQVLRNNTINIFAHRGLHFVVNKEHRTQNDESRLELIKQQILLKLGFKRRPTVSKRLPNAFIWETIFRADGFQGLNDFNNNRRHQRNEYRGNHLNQQSKHHQNAASIHRMNHSLRLYSTSNFDSKNNKNHSDKENGTSDAKVANSKQSKHNGYFQSHTLNHLIKLIQPVYPNYSMDLHSKLNKVGVSNLQTRSQSLPQTLINSKVLSNNIYQRNNFKRNINKTITYLMDNSADDRNYWNRDFKFIKNVNVKYRKFPSQKYDVKFKIDENDDFSGNTREIIIFSEKGNLYKQHRLIEFSSRNIEILNQNLIIRNAEIHIRIDRVHLPTRKSRVGRRKVLSNKKRLKIWIFHLRQTNYTQKGNKQIARFCASFEVNPEMLGWQKIDLTPIVKEWITYQQTERLHLLIDCTGCGKEYSLNLFENNSQKNSGIIQNRSLKLPSSQSIWMSSLKTEQRKLHNLTVEGENRTYNPNNSKKKEEKLFGYKFHSDVTSSDKNINPDTVTLNEVTKHYDVDLNVNSNSINPNRPFVVLRIEPKQQHHVQKRAINCNSVTNGQCCKESFYVSFKALGWDDWIIAPRGYFANYCRGDCVHKFRTPDKFRSFHTHFIEEYRKMGLLNGMKPCCTPIKFSSMSLIYYGDEGIVKRDLPKMVVDECGCP